MATSIKAATSSRVKSKAKHLARTAVFVDLGGHKYRVDNGEKSYWIDADPDEDGKQDRVEEWVSTTPWAQHGGCLDAYVRALAIAMSRGRVKIEESLQNRCRMA